MKYRFIKLGLEKGGGGGGFFSLGGGGGKGGGGGARGFFRNLTSPLKTPLTPPADYFWDILHKRALQVK